MKKFKICIDSGAKIQNFVDIMNTNCINAVLENKDGKYRVNACSLLGGLATLEWEEVWVVSEQNIYSLIEDFIVA